MTNSEKLRSERAKVINDMAVLNAKCETENRDLTSEETVTYEKMKADEVVLRSRYSRIDEQAELERELNASTGRIVDPLQGRSIATTDTHTADRKGEAYRSAMGSYLRTGDTTQFRSLNEAVNADRGFTVSTAVWDQITNALNRGAVVRKAGATVIQTKVNTTFPVSSTVTGGWGVESVAQAGNTDPVYSAFTAKAWRYDVNTKASEELLADSSIDIEAHIAERFTNAIVQNTDNAYVTGTGVGQPLGLMTSAVPFTTASATTFTAKELLSFFYSLPAQYRTQSSTAWLAGDQTIGVIAGMSAPASTTTYINFMPSLTPGDPDRLNGKPLYSCGALEVPFTTGQQLMAIGAFKYLTVVDRINQAGLRRLNELFSLTHEVGFIYSFRTDSQLLVADAFRKMKLA